MDNNINTTDNVELTSTKTNVLKVVYDWLDSIVISVIAVIILFAFVFRVVSIVGDSMNNTLNNGDRIVIFNLFIILNFFWLGIIEEKESKTNTYYQ